MSLAEELTRIYKEYDYLSFLSDENVDVVGALTEQSDYEKARKYWNKLKQRLKEEGSQLVTKCHQLKMTAQDGKKRFTDVANAE